VTNGELQKLFSACNDSWLHLKDKKDEIESKCEKQATDAVTLQEENNKLKIEALRLQYLLRYHSAACPSCDGTGITPPVYTDAFQLHACACPCHKESGVKYVHG